MREPMPEFVHAVTRTGPGEPSPAAPDRLVAGTPAATTWNAFTGGDGRFHVGHWSSEAGVRRVRYDETELCLVLEGRVRLTGPDGAVEFGLGDAFVIASGFVGSWESIGRVTKLYAILEP